MCVFGFCVCCVFCDCVCLGFVYLMNVCVSILRVSCFLYVCVYVLRMLFVV